MDSLGYVCILFCFVVSSGCDQTVNTPALLADLQSDLPQCPSVELEAHQNKVTECVWNANKNQLATA